MTDTQRLDDARSEPRRPAPDDLTNLRRYFARVLLDEAALCATGDDLRKSLGHVMWLSALTNKLLAAAVLSYSDDPGTLPGTTGLNLARRAVRALDDPGTRVPGDETGDLTGLLLQALMAERAANHAVSAAHTSALELP
ncbi:hypothetical protein [Streptomyces sp. AMCC400023]|uniref:hypothetical protein n=1 Tax=Streptomyces sp. AMCC400023 TaxID=2056258 RepID=UPI001F450670|nr:hypothetical protein [Streptomyces sp. AMCC400023]UJV42927.1 hypothetical protein CVT30_26570 [Streptomyces sp. AMCC400023]